MITPHDSIDDLTAEQMAAAHGISRRMFFNRIDAGLMASAPWSRAWLSRFRPYARHAYLEVLADVLKLTIGLHGYEHVAPYLVHNFPDLPKVLVEHQQRQSAQRAAQTKRT